MHVLTQISGYAETCLSQTSNVLGQMLEPTGQEKRSKVLVGMLPVYDAQTLPNDVVPELKACLEYASDEFGSLIVSLLIDLQVQQSRFQSLWKDVKDSESTIVTRHHFESAFLDAASIKGHADNLYEYARFQTNVVPNPLEWDTVVNAIARYSGPHLSGAFELISLRQQSDKKPELMTVGQYNSS